MTVTDVAPTAGFTWLPAPQSEGSAVAFTDTSTSSPDSIVSWSWDFGGLGSSSLQNPSFTFNDNGSHTVTLTVTDDDGLQSNDTISVNVSNKFNPIADAGADQEVEEGNLVSLDGSNSSDADGTIASYSWTQTAGTMVMPAGVSSAAATFISILMVEARTSRAPRKM